MTGLEKLQEIGAQRIFEQTHIAKRFVEDILRQNFSSMNKIQFTGFISILEREYSVDLHELSEAFAVEQQGQSGASAEPFVVSEQSHESSKPKGAYLIAGGIVLGIITIVLLVNSGSDKKEKVEVVKEESKSVKVIPVEHELNNSIIEQAKTHLNRPEVALNDQEPSKETLRVEPVHTSKFEIIPRSKLWIGIVDLESFKRTQKLTADPFELDADKEWLLVMGHGYVDFSVNDEPKSFKEERKVWFAYENGKLSQITRAEFKEKNRGKAW